jgi:hypothetical protein
VRKREKTGDRIQKTVVKPVNGEQWAVRKTEDSRKSEER